MDRFVEIDADWLVRIQRSGDTDQVLGQIGIDLPRPRRVGVGQRIARHGRAEVEMMKAFALRREAGLDVAQRLAKSQLREGHRVELIEARERLDLALATMT
jgi:hypothetical protein